MAELNISCPRLSGSVISSSGITLEEHENIDSLIHGLSEDTHTEIVRVEGKVAQVNTLTAPAGTNIRGTQVSRNQQGVVTGTVTVQYDSGGVEIQKLISTINRDASGTVVSVETEELP